MTTHGPVMPVRTCGGCDMPWPSPTRKRELRGEYPDAPVSLALHLGAYLVQATEDMPWTPAGVLHRRFLGWTREECVTGTGARTQHRAVSSCAGRT
ncbi:hypothetical protein [Micromonospora sp. CNB394]|uniref:hypothetical protein n=1 Tax=Micromonospora sp. CNB394 TaxID=1169151 RepID=UPI0003732460|nr:hypothetical protein [Micromonospora sp. CNB394]